MTEYIERESAREAVWQILNGIGYSEKHNDRLVEEVDAILDDIPADDVLPVVRGRWEKADTSLVWNSYGLYAAAYKCDKCGEFNIAETNYCPNCGADMRGDQDV